MPGAAEEQAAARTQRQRLIVRIRLELADIGDEKLDLLAVQCAAEFLPVIHLKTGVHFRVGLKKSRQCPRHQLHRRCRPASEVQLASIELGHLQHFATQLCRALDQTQGVLQHHLALGRRAQVLVATVYQNTAELLFQALDTAAEGRLGDAHGVRGANKTAVFSEGDEVTQLAKIHMLSRHSKNTAKVFAAVQAQVLNASSYSVNEASVYLLELICISIEQRFQRRFAQPSQMRVKP
ncbi:hypothetical protein D3C79_775440 [compost metagenome]